MLKFKLNYKFLLIIFILILFYIDIYYIIFLIIYFLYLNKNKFYYYFLLITTLVSKRLSLGSILDPIPMFVVNRDIYRNVMEYCPRQKWVTTCGGAMLYQYASISHLTAISVMIIVGDGYLLCVTKLFFLFLII